MGPLDYVYKQALVGAAAPFFAVLLVDVPKRMK